MNVRLGTFTECGSRARGFRREGLVVATASPREDVRRERLPRHPFLAQSPHLGIPDQPVLHKENGQSHTTLGGSTNRPIASSATGKNNWSLIS